MRIIYYDMFWETCSNMSDVDISEQIDLEVLVHIQSIVLTLEQFHCYIYVWTFFVFILIK